MPAERHTTYLCVTARKDTEGLDAAGQEWRYKFSPAE
jgi:hypothetical protein